ncbi:metal ABC transporter ATP-binding protein [soil metagenome]
MAELQRNQRLATEHLSVHFGDRSALDDVTLAFGPSEVVSLVGPNGGGKSTLLRCLAGILHPSHGSVMFNGQPISGPDPSVIYVPQRTLVDWTFPISVLDVVLMARMQQRSRLRAFLKDDRLAALSALSKVGMDHLSGVQISQLSGGQQQRVFLARALLAEGEVYLLDEPFTGIDAPTQEFITRLFQDLCQSGKTVIAATHDFEQAMDGSDRVVLINRRVLADGPPQLVFSPETLQLAYGSQLGFLSRFAAAGTVQ